MTQIKLRGSRRSSSLSNWANRHRKWIFAGPAVIFVAALIVIPLGYTIYLSFTDAANSLRADMDFVGLDNYVAVLTDTVRFWPAVGRTVVFTVGVVAVELILGMGIALLLRRPFRGERIVRGIILLPLVATPIAVGMMWRLIFEPSIGFANQLLNWLGLPDNGWISDPNQALPTLMFVDIWQWTPMMVLILLAGLTSLPDEPDEAARVDGASAFQRFRYVTLPLLMPALVAGVVLRSIDAFKTFDILFATKGAGGGSLHEVETVNIYAYGENFLYNQYGLASAVLMVFFAMVLILVSVQLLRRKDRA
jgi:multiple sugar transport system permease protein